MVNLDSYGQTWNFSGNPSDFASRPQAIPCWSGNGGAALGGCAITTEPQACIAAASAISANTLNALNSVGCYLRGSSVLVPPALGTIGDSRRNMFRGSGFRNWDVSIMKNWKFQERLTAQFRAEFFNVLNHPELHEPRRGRRAPDSQDASAGTFGWLRLRLRLPYFPIRLSSQLPCLEPVPIDRSNWE